MSLNHQIDIVSISLVELCTMHLGRGRKVIKDKIQRSKKQTKEQTNKKITTLSHQTQGFFGIIQNTRC